MHVYLHLSQDATAHRLEEYVRRGQVTLRAWDFDWSPMFMRFQSHALNDCLLRRFVCVCVCVCVCLRGGGGKRAREGARAHAKDRE